MAAILIVSFFWQAFNQRLACFEHFQHKAYYYLCCLLYCQVIMQSMSAFFFSDGISTNVKHSIFTFMYIIQWVFSYYVISVCVKNLTTILYGFKVNTLLLIVVASQLYAVCFVIVVITWACASLQSQPYQLSCPLQLLSFFHTEPVNCTDSLTVNFDYNLSSIFYAFFEDREALRDSVSLSNMQLLFTEFINYPHSHLYTIFIKCLAYHHMDN